ncbi:MAG: prepilin-type N-terminal cleavage/methylation domain-containing protein [Methylotenera sp.]|nr:prepilin-type N-terminal cleavage/methylation domain-containing protein [Methylotenera sp.]
MMTSRPHRSAGFTLIEIVMVIVIIGIISGMVAVFVVKPVQGYVDAVHRAELTDSADVALRRLTRDVRLAFLRWPSMTILWFITWALAMHQQMLMLRQTPALTVTAPK